MNANRTFSILLFSSILILIGLIALSAKITPLLLSHAVYVCQKTFSNVIFTLSHSVPLILITFAIAILLIGTIAYVYQLLKTRFYLKKHLNKRIPIPNNLRVVISNLNLNGKINIVKDESRLSFCYGILSPKICLSTGLIKSLTFDELKAVLLHEGYHVRNHDPLKIILGQTASIMFFFIPILKEIQQYFALSKEIAADNMAIKYVNKQSLISVLNKLLIAPTPYYSGIAALANFDDLEKRILYLTGGQKKAVFKPSLVSTSLSTFIILFSMVVVNTPVYDVRVDDSCKAKEEVSYSKDLMYTPASYTPK